MVTEPSVASTRPAKIRNPLSRSCDEELWVRATVDLVGSCGTRDVLHEFAAALRTFAFNHAHAAGGHVAGFEADDATFAHLNVRAKPIGAEHSSRGIKRDRGCDRTFEV